MHTKHRNVSNKIVALLLVFLGTVAGCHRGSGSNQFPPFAAQKPTAQQQQLSTNENPQQPHLKNPSDPEESCQAAFDARRNTIMHLKRFQKAVSGVLWEWSDEGADKAAQDVIPALHQESNILKEIVESPQDPELVNAATSEKMKVDKLSDGFENKADPSDIRLSMILYIPEGVYISTYLVQCLQKDYLTREY